MLKYIKTVIQITSFLTISLLFFALWHNSSAGFTSTAALALGSVLLTQWTIQRAWRIKEKSKSSFKLMQVALLVTLSLASSTAGAVASAEYGELEQLAVVAMSEMTNGNQMAFISQSFRGHLEQATQTL